MDAYGRPSIDDLADLPSSGDAHFWVREDYYTIRKDPNHWQVHLGPQPLGFVRQLDPNNWQADRFDVRDPRRAEFRSWRDAVLHAAELQPPPSTRSLT